jgi:putative endonuclease
MEAYVYILTNQARSTLYIGVTGNPSRRLEEHFSEAADGFTKKYHLKRVVYIELVDTIELAIAREKQLKSWRRQWKINLMNPTWQDLAKKYRMDAEINSA